MSKVSQDLPLAYSSDPFSQATLALGTGVFAPRQSFSAQIHQLCHNYYSCNPADCTSPHCKYYSSRTSSSSSSVSCLSLTGSRSNSTSSLSSDCWDSRPSSLYDEAYPQPDMTTTSVRPPISISCTADLVCKDADTPKVSFSALPFEIRSLIAQECLQADAFHLCLTSKAFYESTVSRLYQCIVFDSAHRHFNKEISYKRLKPSSASRAKHDKRDNYFSFTSVRTVGGLRGCMRALKTDDTKAAYVRRFECLNSMDLPDLEIRAFVKEVFPRMPNLACLIWDASPEITVDLIEYLAHPEQMRTLSLDIALRNDPISRNITTMTFPMLTHLTLRPYLSSNFLVLLARMVANSPATLHNLRSLYLGRELHKTHEVGSGFAFASMNPQNAQGSRIVDDQAISSFFGTLLERCPGTKLKLRQLGLDGITVHCRDFEILDQCVDFHSTTHLYLAGTDMTGSEIEDMPHPQPQDTWTPRFLSYLSPKLVKLKQLEIDWSEAVVDTVPTFLSDLPRGLRSLSVKLRWNSSKAEHFSWEQLCFQYIDAIVAKHGLSLKQLALDAVEDMAFYDPFKAIPSTALINLCNCLHLTSLSIPAPSPPPQPGQALERLLGSLPRLRFFHLRNQHTKPYLGQNVSYLIEDWLRYKHIVESIMVAQLPSTALEFIKLENYVFDVRVRSQPAVIREGLLTWFDEKLFDPWEK